MLQWIFIWQSDEDEQLTHRTEQIEYEEKLRNNDRDTYRLVNEDDDEHVVCGLAVRGATLRMQ